MTIYNVLLHILTADKYTLSQHALKSIGIVTNYMLPFYVSTVMPLQAFRAWAGTKYVNYREGMNIKEFASNFMIEFFTPEK